MKKLCTYLLASGLVLLTALATLTMPQWGPLWGGVAVAKENKGAFTKAEMARMSTFLSNFTELQLMNFTAAEVLNPKDPELAIRFGVWHNYINNYTSRVVSCDEKKFGPFCLGIDGKYVLESIEKYFGRNAEFVEGLKTRQPAEFDGRFYHFPAADGAPAYHADVQSAETNPDGTITMRGVVFNADNYDDVPGPFEALARPQTWNGKATWVILRLSVPGYTE